MPKLTYLQKKRKKTKIVYLRNPDRINKIIGKGVSAISFPEQRVIFVRQGRTNRTEIEHEKGHIALRHKNKQPTNPITHVNEELAADYYAYKSIGKPHHILAHLRRLYNDLSFREYRIRPTSRILTIIKNGLDRLPDTPQGWREDYNKLLFEYRNYGYHRG